MSRGLKLFCFMGERMTLEETPEERERHYSLNTQTLGSSAYAWRQLLCARLSLQLGLMRSLIVRVLLHLLSSRDVPQHQVSAAGMRRPRCRSSRAHVSSRKQLRLLRGLALRLPRHVG